MHDTSAKHETIIIDAAIIVRGWHGVDGVVAFPSCFQRNALEQDTKELDLMLASAQ